MPPNPGSISHGPMNMRIRNDSKSLMIQQCRGSMKMSRRVVVTGIGMVTPVGKNVEETWEVIAPAWA
jgi:hypothetical protein